MSKEQLEALAALEELTEARQQFEKEFYDKLTSELAVFEDQIKHLGGSVTPDRTCNVGCRVRDIRRWIEYLESVGHGKNDADEETVQSDAE